MTKTVNQIAVAGLVPALAEVLNFAGRVRLDRAAVLDRLTKGAAQSGQMEHRWQTMVERKFDLGFAVERIRKDLWIFLEEARRNGA